MIYLPDGVTGLLEEVGRQRKKLQLSYVPVNLKDEPLKIALRGACKLEEDAEITIIRPTGPQHTKDTCASAVLRHPPLYKF